MKRILVYFSIAFFCAVFLGGVILGGADSGTASAADQDIKTTSVESYTISYEDFNHVKPGPSVTMPPEVPTVASYDAASVNSQM